MPRPSHLSSDNILRFLQLRRDPASADDIAAALHVRRSDRQTLHKMLNTLKKRRAVEELPGGRYQLAGRSDRANRESQSQPKSRQPEQSRASAPAHSHSRSAAPVTAPPVSPRDEIKGRLVLHQDGYGFVVPDSPVPGLDRDVFIPRDAVEDAMHGDHVQVQLQRLYGAGESQRTEGRIVRVLDRAHPSIVGLFRYGARGNSVLPYDSRMQHAVDIPPGH